MAEWIKNHPYLSGGLVLLVVVYFVIRSRSSSGTTIVGTNSQVQLANIQAQLAEQQLTLGAQVQQQTLEAALGAEQIKANRDITVAQLQSGVATAAIGQQTTQEQIAAGVVNAQTAGDIQKTQIAAGVASGQIAAQLAGVESTNAATEDIAGIQAEAQTAQAQIAGDTAYKIAGTQAQVAELQSNNQVAQQKQIDQTAIQINGQNTGTQKYLGDVAAGVYKAQTAAQLAAIYDNNKTAVTIDANNNTIAQNITQLNTNRDVNVAQIGSTTQLGLGQLQSTTELGLGADAESIYQQLIAAQHDVATKQIGAQQTLYQQVLDIIHGTNYNKGGEGGANQVAIGTALLGQPSIGVAAEQTQNPQPGNTWGAILTGVGNLFSGLGKGLSSFF